MARLDLPAAVDRLHERLFVAGYDRVQRASERAGMREIRRDLVARASGSVLEIGAGTGLNLGHYGPAVTEIVALEPAAEMRAVLASAVDGGHDARVRVVAGTAERLPVEDGSVDVVVGTFVLCSVAEPALVLAEIARVLRPDGRYLGLEHVRSARPAVARAQHAVAPAWRWAVRGCRCDQEVCDLLAVSPLRVVDSASFTGPRQPWPVRPGLRFEARRPSPDRLADGPEHRRTRPGQ